MGGGPPKPPPVPAARIGTCATRQHGTLHPSPFSSLPRRPHLDLLGTRGRGGGGGAANAELPPEDDAVEMASAAQLLDSVAEAGPNYTLLRSKETKAMRRKRKREDARVHAIRTFRAPSSLIIQTEWGPLVRLQLVSCILWSRHSKSTLLPACGRGACRLTHHRMRARCSSGRPEHGTSKSGGAQRRGRAGSRFRKSQRPPVQPAGS